LELTDILLFLNKNVFATLDHSIKMVSAQAALLDACLAQAQLPAVDVLHQLLPTMTDHAVALLDSISKLPPLDSANNALNIAQLALLLMPVRAAPLTSLLSMELALAPVEDSLAMDNVSPVFLAAKHAQALLHATFAILLFSFKPTLVFQDVDQVSINLDLLAMHALTDVLLAQDLTFVHSVNQESLLIMDSAMLTVLLDQLLVLTLLLVLPATLHVPPALSTQASAQAATHAVVPFSTSNAFQAALLDLILSTELANTAHTTVLPALEATLLVHHAQQQRFSSMEHAMKSVHM
jgi:hypothetical protein